MDGLVQARRPALRHAPRPLRVAMLAPPWIAVPPPGYGGVERVVSDLTSALVARGHDVTLFCAPGSVSDAKVVTLLDRTHPDEIERSVHEADHVARAFAEVDVAAAAGQAFDVVHDHCGFTALAMADRVASPLIHTLHGPFTDGTSPFYARHGHKATLVAISRAQVENAPPRLRPLEVIPNPIDASAWSLQERKEDYVLWIGRITPEKGPHRAIAAARAAGVRIVLAGVVQPGRRMFFDREIAPYIDGDRVVFLGEVGGAAKQAAFAGARALLMPIEWHEPFGMVMIEALACGTPVIAFPAGAAPEIVEDGRTGYLVADVPGMAAAIGRTHLISARACRSWVREHCDLDVVGAAYERTYRAVARGPAASLV